MNEKPATLETFFGFSRDSARGSEEFAAMEAGLPAARVEEAVKKANDNRAVPISSAAFIAAIGGILNVPLLDIIVRAWNEGKLFRKYLDPETYDPEEVISITLKEHEVTSSHQPKIDVVLNGQTIDSIDFQLDITLALEGVDPGGPGREHPQGPDPAGSRAKHPEVRKPDRVRARDGGDGPAGHRAVSGASHRRSGRVRRGVTRCDMHYSVVEGIRTESVFRQPRRRVNGKGPRHNGVSHPATEGAA